MEKMNNSSFSSDTDDAGFGLPVVSLHEAFQVLLIVFLAIGLVGSFIGNTLLLILLCLGRKTLNSTGVYLIFLAILNLVYSLIAFEGMTALLARRWVFGSEMCHLSTFLIYPVYFSIIYIHPFIATDLVWYTFRPLKYRRRKLPAFLCSILALSYPFIAQVILSGGNYIQVQEFWLLPDGRKFTLCRSWRRRPGSPEVLVPLLSVPEVVVAYAVIVVCCVLYAVALVKVRLAQQARKRTREQVFKDMSNADFLALDFDQDASFYGSRETQTIKSLAGVFILQITSTLFPLTVSLFTVPTPPFWVYLVNFVVVLLASQISLLLVLTNKLYRGRIADILACSCKVEQQRKMGVLWASRARRLSRKLSRHPPVSRFSKKSRHRLSPIHESEEDVHICHSFGNTVAPEKIEARDVCSVDDGQSLSQMSQGRVGRSSPVSQGGEGSLSGVSRGRDRTWWAVSQGEEESSSAVSSGGHRTWWAVSQGGEGSSMAVSQEREGNSSAVSSGGHSTWWAVSQGGEGSSSSVFQGGDGNSLAESQGEEGRWWAVAPGGKGRSWAVSQGEDDKPPSMTPVKQRRDGIHWALRQISPSNDGDQGMLDVVYLV